jgi:hypothetical protein
LSHLYIKVIILTRQARDKQRENSEKSPFFAGGGEKTPTLCVFAMQFSSKTRSIICQDRLGTHARKNLKTKRATCVVDKGIAVDEKLTAELTSLQERLTKTETLLLALQNAYTTKAAEVAHWAQYSLSAAEEAEQLQAVAVGSGVCCPHVASTPNQPAPPRSESAPPCTMNAGWRHAPPTPTQGREGGSLAPAECARMAARLT